MGIFHHVTGNVSPIIRIFSVIGMVFHFALSQEIFFLLDKVIIFFLKFREGGLESCCKFKGGGVVHLQKRIFRASLTLYQQTGAELCQAQTSLG